MSGYTPGPWYVADWTNDHGDNKTTVEARTPDIVSPGQTSIWPGGVRKMMVASTEGSDGDALADARLISAAPEMLEALEAFSGVRIERAHPQAEATDPWPDDKILFGYDNWFLTVGMVRAARAAIAKAKGETT